MRVSQPSAAQHHSCLASCSVRQQLYLHTDHHLLHLPELHALFLGGELQALLHGGGLQTLLHVVVNSPLGLQPWLCWGNVRVLGKVLSFTLGDSRLSDTRVISTLSSMAVGSNLSPQLP